MKQLVYLSVLCVLALTACTGGFKKGADGIEYKIIADGKGSTIGYGNFMQFQIKRVYAGAKDTVLMDSRDFAPSIQVFDSVNTPLAYYKIIKQLRKGDSLVLRILTDSIFKDPKNTMPPYMKNGKYLYTYLKIVNIFTTPQEADSADRAEKLMAKPKIWKKKIEAVEKEMANNKQQLETDDKLIEAYLAKNNIKATKTKWGTYIAVTEEGTGEPINWDDVATVNYTGRTLDSGKVFDSNTDPKFNHVQPYEVSISQMGEANGVIYGWVDALTHIKNGSKVTIFVPSSLAYGEHGNGNIKPNENLIFDIEVKAVESEASLMAKQQEMQQKMMEDQKRHADSINKATQK